MSRRVHGNTFFMATMRFFCRFVLLLLSLKLRIYFVSFDTKIFEKTLFLNKHGNAVNNKFKDPSCQEAFKHINNMKNPISKIKGPIETWEKCGVYEVTCIGIIQQPMLESFKARIKEHNMYALRKQNNTTSHLANH